MAPCEGAGRRRQDVQDLLLDRALLGRELSLGPADRDGAHVDPHASQLQDLAIDEGRRRDGVGAEHVREAQSRTAVRRPPGLRRHHRLAVRAVGSPAFTGSTSIGPGCGADAR